MWTASPHPRRGKETQPIQGTLNARALEADVLLNIGRLPLLPAGDLEWLTDAPADAVRRALDALHRHGWIDFVQRGRSPDEPRLYVLRHVAAPAFAEAFQLPEAEARLHWPMRRGDILRAVSSIEISVGVDGLLARLAAGWMQTGGTVLDLRALPRSRRGTGRWWPSWMQGYYCLERDGEVYHAFVAWDAVGAPDAHRRARVRSWYDALEAADHWGTGQLPPVLLVCPGRAQERVWRDAILSTARRRDAYPLQVAVTTPEAAGSGDVLGEWSWLDEEATVPFEDVLVPRQLQPPMTAPRPRLDLIDRGVSIHAPTLHEWAQQVLAADPARATRDGDAARSMSLSEAHRCVLQLVVRHPYLTERQVAELLGEAVEPVRQLLTDLERHGLLSSVALPGTHN